MMEFARPKQTVAKLAILYGTTRSKPNQTSHFPPCTWQLCNMQQLQRYLTLKIVRFPNIVFLMLTSNSMLANPASNPSVSFLLTVRLFTVIPYICEMHCPANVTMMVVDVLAPNRHQCIANHHRDSSLISGFNSSHQYNIHIPLRPLNKQYLREVSSSATCCWQCVRLLTRITPDYQSMLSTYNSHS